MFCPFCFGLGSGTQLLCCSQCRGALVSACGDTEVPSISSMELNFLKLIRVLRVYRSLTGVGVHACSWLNPSTWPAKASSGRRCNFSARRDALLRFPWNNNMQTKRKANKTGCE